MIIYEVSGGGFAEDIEGSVYYPTKSEAVACAKRNNADSIEKLWIPHINREILCACINRRGFVDKHETVWTKPNE